MKTSTRIMISTLSISALLGYASYMLVTDVPSTNYVLIADASIAGGNGSESRIALPRKITALDIDNVVPTHALTANLITKNVIISDSSSADSSTTEPYILLPGKIIDSDADSTATVPTKP